MDIYISTYAGFSQSFGVRGFGEVETFFTVAKFGFLLIIIVACAIISSGQGDKIGCSSSFSVR
jgi:amino acid transporter